MLIDDLDTPVVLIDLDGLEDNLDRFQRYYDQHKIGLRPHIKTHKTVAISHMQIARGAIGLCCQTLGEAEVMVAGGVHTDILIPYNIVGDIKLDRLTALARQVPITVAVDSEYTVAGISGAAADAGVMVGVLIEIESGGKRVGVLPEKSAELGRIVDNAPGLELKGVMSFPTPPETRPFFLEALAQFDKAGLPHPVVSGGSTKSAFVAHEVPEFTEYRIGEYIAGGAGHLASGCHTVSQCAIRVLTTVVSRPDENRACLDAGSKTMSSAERDSDQGSRMGYVIEYPEAHFYSASEEHGMLDLSKCSSKPNIGDRVQVLPVHPCPCINEHDEMVAVRGNEVIAHWPVLARGKVQ